MNFLEHIGIIRSVPDLDPTIIFSIAGFPIASSTLMILFIVLLTIVFIVFVNKTFSVKPGRVQTVVELLYEEIVALIKQTTNSEKHARAIFPIIAAMLVYLTVSNLISLIPGLTEITYQNTPIFRSPTADFNTTFGLAFGSVLIIQLISIKDWGLFGYIGKYLRFKEVFQGFKKGITSGFVALIDFFVGLLDIIGEFAKIISLALRLFGNMYAGNVLMIILFGAVAYVIPSLWLGMNIFIGILQALVFSLLVVAYYMLAIKPDPEENEEESITNN